MTYKYCNSGNDVDIFRVGDIPELTPCCGLNMQNPTQEKNASHILKNIQDGCKRVKVWLRLGGPHNVISLGV